VTKGEAVLCPVDAPAVAPEEPVAPLDVALDPDGDDPELDAVLVAAASWDDPLEQPARRTSAITTPESRFMAAR
jgi:hypothetical protein